MGPRVTVGTVAHHPATALRHLHQPFVFLRRQFTFTSHPCSYADNLHSPATRIVYGFLPEINVFVFADHLHSQALVFLRRPFTFTGTRVPTHTIYSYSLLLCMQLASIHQQSFMQDKHFSIAHFLVDTWMLTHLPVHHPSSDPHGVLPIQMMGGRLSA